MFASEAGAFRQLLSSDPSKGNVQTLTTGDNTLTKPSGADYLLIVPDRYQTGTITLKGNAADTGVVIASAADRSPTLLNVTGASVIATVSANVNAAIVWASRNGRLVGA